MLPKSNFNVYTENLIAGLERYSSKKLIQKQDAVNKELKNINYSNVKTVALVIDDKTGRVLVRQNPNGKSYDLPMANIKLKTELDTLWRPCLKNLKDNYGIIAQIGDGLGAIYPMNRVSDVKHSTSEPEKTSTPLKQYHVFEMKNYQQSAKSKVTWKDFKAVFVDMLRSKKYEQAEALLRTHYVSANSELKNHLSNLNFLQLNKGGNSKPELLFSCFQKHSVNVFASAILKQKVGNEYYVLLANNDKPQHTKNNDTSIWTFPQFPVTLFNYPNIQDTPSHNLGEILAFKNSMLFLKVLFSANISDKKQFYDDNLQINKSKTSRVSFLNWDFKEIMQDFRFDFRFYTNDLLRVMFEPNKNGKQYLNNTSFLNDMLPIEVNDNIFLENYYFDSLVYVRDVTNPLTPFVKNGINYKWVKMAEAASHFKKTNNNLESILMRNYMSRTYTSKRQQKIFPETKIKS